MKLFKFEIQKCGQVSCVHKAFSHAESHVKVTNSSVRYSMNVGLINFNNHYSNTVYMTSYVKTLHVYILTH